MTSYIITDNNIKAIVFTSSELEKIQEEYSSVNIDVSNDYNDLEKKVLKLKSGKLYAVKAGIINGIYFDWNTCSKMIKNVSGALYKGFQTLKEAVDYMDLNTTATAPETNLYKTPYAYVDGSYNEKTKQYGCGVVIVDETSTYEFFDSDNDIEMVSMQNVAGEILGAKIAITEAIAMGLSEITIYYDYQGIECWANGTWKRNKKGTIEYYNFIQEAKEIIKINFIKVKAHSGVKLNEAVDKLAKKAVGI